MSNNMSGCELSNLLNVNIGLDDVKMCIDNDKMLGKYSDDELIEEIVNNNDRDIESMIVELYTSLIELGDPDTLSKIKAFKKILTDG